MTVAVTVAVAVAVTVSLTVVVTVAVLVTVAVTVTYLMCTYDAVGVIEVEVDVVAVRDGVREVVAVPLTDGDIEGDGLTVRVEVAVGHVVGVSVAVSDGLAVRDVVGVWVSVWLAVADWLGVWLGVAVRVGVGDGISVSRTMIFTPEYTTDTSVVHWRYAVDPVEYTGAGTAPPDFEKICGEAFEDPSYIRTKS